MSTKQLWSRFAFSMASFPGTLPVCIHVLKMLDIVSCCFSVYVRFFTGRLDSDFAIDVSVASFFMGCPDSDFDVPISEK